MWSFPPKTATRSDRNFLVEMVRRRNRSRRYHYQHAGHCRLLRPLKNTASMFARGSGARARLSMPRESVLSSHCHDDLGLAVANSLAAISNGARQVECTINGIGERAGNAALEEIAAALYVRGDRLRSLDRHQAGESLLLTSQVLGQIITFRPSPNKAIVGDNAFAHESGIHQHGMLANPLCYEIMTPVAGWGGQDASGPRQALRPRRSAGIRLGAARLHSHPRGVAADLLSLRRPCRPQERTFTTRISSV
jgi:2-isopropylmalate synthase